MFTLRNILRYAKANSVYVDTPCYSHKGKYRMLKSNVFFRLSNNDCLFIQKGVYWDESSVPYILQWAFPKSGIYAIPSLIHDALYFKTETSREFADKEFKTWMQALGTSKFQVFFRYWAVKLFGWIYWRRNVNNPSERCMHNRQLIYIIKS